MRTLVLFAAIALMGQVQTAVAYCSAPSVPSCATRYGPFDDEDDFDHCKRQMRSYKDEANEFLACRKREADSLIDEYNNAVESFNRRARG